VLAGIDDDVLLIAPEVIKPIQELKINHLGNKNPRLHTDETLIALSISAVNDEKAKLALSSLFPISIGNSNFFKFFSARTRQPYAELFKHVFVNDFIQTKRLLRFQFRQ